ncbi:UDP-4-amino-4,6-dideoxy-N-acetyl-beta-L-altrosamine transaminase [Fibrobacterota bacterium]
MIPYGRQFIDDEDMQAVVDVLRSDWLTTGPAVEAFEQAVAGYVGAEYAVAVSNGTAALHAAMHAIGIGPGDEVIVPPLTFAATANCVVYQGGVPVFADVDPQTLLINPEAIEAKITPRTRAIIAVDYAGQPCDYDALRSIAESHKLKLVADVCHALGAEYKGHATGTLADMSIFSFHPVKHITSGEGGMVTTNYPELYQRLHRFRNHGISVDHHQRQEKGTWFYEISDLGYNYRITDIQCALGRSQLKKLPEFLKRRKKIAEYYDGALKDIAHLTPLTVSPEVSHAYHLYVVKCDFEHLQITRAKLFQEMREKGVGLNVHYIPVHLHSFYQRAFNTAGGLCPVAEKVYDQIVSLPMFYGLKDEDMHRVISCLKEVLGKHQ